MNHASFWKRWAQEFKLFLPVPTYIFPTVLPNDRKDGVGTTTVQHKDAPSGYQERLFHCEGGWALAQAAQGGYEFPSLDCH